MLGKLLILGCIVLRTYQFCPQSCVCNNNLLSVQCKANNAGGGGGGGDGALQTNTLSSSSSHHGNNHNQNQQYHGTLNEIPIFLNPQIQSLNIHGNQIIDVSLSLQFYTQLEYLDLSLNKILTVGNSNFENLKKLVYLNISNNQIQSLSEHSLKGLVSLINLDLSRNFIETIDYSVFKNLAQLQTINFNYNRLEFIDWSILYGLANLQRLSLEHNYIKTIERLFINNYYWTLDNLVELNFNFNQLTALDENSFDLFSNMRRLDAAGNKIVRLAETTFSNNPHLSHLDLSQNRIGVIPPSFFSKLTELKYLDLSFNHVHAIGSTTFNNLFKLEFIDVSSNPISVIEASALLDNINLVDFYGNHLQFLSNLSISLLSNKPFLRSFSLQHCNLTYIDFHNQYQLIQKFDLTGNPWNCNCSTLSIYKYLVSRSSSSSSSSGSSATLNTNTNNLHTINNLSGGTGHDHHPDSDSLVSLLSSVSCASPESLQGVPLTKLSLSDFHDCLSTYDSFTNTVLISAGVLVGLLVVVVAVKICLVLGLIGLRRKGRGTSRRGHPEVENGGRVGVGVGGLGGVGNGGHEGTIGRGRSALTMSLKTPHNTDNYHSTSSDMDINHQNQNQSQRYNEEIFLNFPTRNASNLTLSSQYTHVYDKQVPSVLV